MIRDYRRFFMWLLLVYFGSAAALTTALSLMVALISSLVLASLHVIVFWFGIPLPDPLSMFGEAAAGTWIATLAEMLWVELWPFLGFSIVGIAWIAIRHCRQRTARNRQD